MQNKIPKAQRISKKLIPVLPEGVTPFAEHDLLRSNIRTPLHTVSLYELGDTLDDLIEVFTSLKKELAASVNCKGSELPPIRFDLEGPDYEGPDRIEFAVDRWETDEEVTKRLRKQAASKISNFKRRNKERTVK